MNIPRAGRGVPVRAPGGAVSVPAREDFDDDQPESREFARDEREGLNTQLEIDAQRRRAGL